MPHITPTVGRIVNYVNTRGPDGIPTIRPAIVVDVHSDTCITVFVLRAPGDGAPSGIETSRVHSDESLLHTWHWMPYQKGQAAKTEQLEKQVADKA